MNTDEGTVTPLRLEECRCGGLIAANDGDWPDVQAAIDTHAESLLHRTWRIEQEAVEALRRVPVKRCPCHGKVA